MSISMKDLDPALHGAGQKAYPDTTISNFSEHRHEIVIPMFAHVCLLNESLLRVYIRA